METSDVLDLKAFVPARDLEVATSFYTDLGFTLNFATKDIAELQLGSYRILLQPFYVKDHAENFMMSLTVEDADVWWERIERIGLIAKYPGTSAKPPKLQPWGLRVLYLIDPTGVLWHISDRKTE